MTAYSVDEHDVATDLQVWSCDSYLKKVNRSQTWAAVFDGCQRRNGCCRRRLFDLHDDRLQQLRRLFVLYDYDL